MICKTELWAYISQKESLRIYKKTELTLLDDNVRLFQHIADQVNKIV